GAAARSGGRRRTAGPAAPDRDLPPLVGRRRVPGGPPPARGGPARPGPARGTRRGPPPRRPGHGDARRRGRPPPPRPEQGRRSRGRGRDGDAVLDPGRG